MRCYRIAAGTLLSVAAALGPLSAPNTGVYKQPTMREQALRPEGNGCAIPLLETHGKPTGDRIARSGGGPQIDPKMVVAPAVPACPKR